MFNKLLKIYDGKDQKKIFDILQCKTYVYVAIQPEKNIYRISCDMEDPQSLVNQLSFDHSEHCRLYIHYVKDPNKVIRISRHLLNVFATKKYANFKVETWYKMPEEFDEDDLNNLIVEIDNQHDPGNICQEVYENVLVQDEDDDKDSDTKCDENEFFVEMFG